MTYYIIDKHDIKYYIIDKHDITYYQLYFLFIKLLSVHHNYLQGFFNLISNRGKSSLFTSLKCRKYPKLF